MGVVDVDETLLGGELKGRGPCSGRPVEPLWLREGDAYIALCAVMDIASQGKTAEPARAHPIEPLELGIEAADRAEAVMATAGTCRCNPPGRGAGSSG